MMIRLDDIQPSILEVCKRGNRRGAVQSPFNGSRLFTAKGNRQGGSGGLKETWTMIVEPSKKIRSDVEP